MNKLKPKKEYNIEDIEIQQTIVEYTAYLTLGTLLLYVNSLGSMTNGVGTIILSGITGILMLSTLYSVIQLFEIDDVLRGNKFPHTISLYKLLVLVIGLTYLVNRAVKIIEYIGVEVC